MKKQIEKKRLVPVDDEAPELDVYDDTAASSMDPMPKAKAKPKPKPKAKINIEKTIQRKKKGGSVMNRIEEIIEASNLPPREQALLPAHRLTAKVARPKKGRKKKGGGLEPILEHHDIKDDPYYMKPPLPTHVK